MDNGTKFSNEQLENMKTELESGSVNEKSLNEFLQKHLNAEESEKLKAVLADPEKLKNILSTPFAKSFMEKLKKIIKKDKINVDNTLLMTIDKKGNKTIIGKDEK